MGPRSRLRTTGSPPSVVPTKTETCPPCPPFHRRPGEGRGPGAGHGYRLNPRYDRRPHSHIRPVRASTGESVPTNSASLRQLDFSALSAAAEPLDRQAIDDARQRIGDTRRVFGDVPIALAIPGQNQRRRGGFQTHPRPQPTPGRAYRQVSRGCFTNSNPTGTPASGFPFSRE